MSELIHVTVMGKLGKTRGSNETTVLRTLCPACGGILDPDNPKSWSLGSYLNDDAVRMIGIRHNGCGAW